MLVKASATVPVSRPALSFPNQHNTKRNRFSGRIWEFFTAQIRNPHTRAAVVPRLDAPPYRPPQPTLRRV